MNRLQFIMAIPSDERICNELDLESIVHWLGDMPRARLAEEYNRAHVFCLPSHQEGFGIVFLEAMAAGKPIVAVRAPAVPEVVRNGLLVEPESPEALAEGILRLYRNPGLGHSLGSAGCRDVEQFDVNSIAIMFLSEIAKIAPEIKIASALGLSKPVTASDPRTVVEGVRSLLRTELIDGR